MSTSASLLSWLCIWMHQQHASLHVYFDLMHGKWCMDGRQDGVKWSMDSKLSLPLLCLISSLYPWPSLPISLTFSAYIHDLLCLYPWPSLPHFQPISMTFSAYIPDLLCLYPDLLWLISCLYPWPSLPISMTSAYIHDLFWLISCLYPWPLPISMTSSDSSPASIPDLLCLYPWPSLPNLLPISLTFSAYIPDLSASPAYISDLLRLLSCL